VGIAVRHAIPASEAVGGVKEAHASAAEKKVEVFLDNPAVSVDQICKVLQKSGFSGRSASADPVQQAYSGEETGGYV